MKHAARVHIIRFSGNNPAFVRKMSERLEAHRPTESVTGESIFYCMERKEELAGANKRFLRFGGG